MSKFIKLTNARRDSEASKTIYVRSDSIMSISVYDGRTEVLGRYHRELVSESPEEIVNLLEK